MEWHGCHLPIETDMLVAQKICEIISKKTKAYALPPIYLGTDRERKVGNKKFVGMNSKLGKELEGSLYYLKPIALSRMVEGLVENLIKQG
ncbi:MAG: creatininase family protein, partial [Elusimicrobiota bacterium]